MFSRPFTHSKASCLFWTSPKVNTAVKQIFILFCYCLKVETFHCCVNQDQNYLMSLEAYINTDQKPSEVNDFPWLICADDALEEKYCDGQPSGKWMMFFPKTELDSKWLEACDSFRKGKLTGIYQMKVSTFYKNKRASKNSDGVLIFFFVVQPITKLLW